MVNKTQKLTLLMAFMLLASGCTTVAKVVNPYKSESSCPGKKSNGICGQSAMDNLRNAHKKPSTHLLPAADKVKTNWQPSTGGRAVYIAPRPQSVWIARYITPDGSLRVEPHFVYILRNKGGWSRE